jgi:hypothetical protein
MFKPTRADIEYTWAIICNNRDRRFAAFQIFNLQLPYRARVEKTMVDAIVSFAPIETTYEPLPIVTFDLHRHILNPGNLKVWFVTCSDLGEPFVVDRGFGNVG